MIKRWIQALFVAGIVLILAAGTARLLLCPKQVNYYENRYAEQVAPLRAGSYLSGSFQDSMEAALADQIPFAQRAKKLYNTCSSSYLDAFMRRVLQNNPDRYINYRGMRIFGGDTLTYSTRSLSDEAEMLDTHVQNINQIVADNPDAAFYLYYIEKDTDIDFETGEKPGFYAYLTKNLSIPHACFSVDSFSDFHTWFYRTDHHWNYLGSYRAYQQVLQLLDCGDAPLVPQETVTLPGLLSGSKAAQSGDASYAEPFTAYRFDYPSMQISIDGTPAADYGNQDAYFDGSCQEPLQYSSFYGGDAGELHITTGRTDRDNLLLIGESYDNAILKLLASHFHNTYAVDLRYYSVQMGKDFHLASYLAEHDIQKVLLIGNIDYFVMQEFLLEN